jgi:3-phenylpropionate/trans-cinnamate dioxygenase ferredoxin reductase subunit
MAGTVIVGAGHAGAQTAFSLRAEGYRGPITLLSAEERSPYQRPPLSKGYLAALRRRETDADDLINLHPVASYAEQDIALRLGSPVSEIDRHARRVHTTTGKAYGYDHLVLATGARARTLPFTAPRSECVRFFRTHHDAAAIAALTADASRVAVVGGGFVGLEAASVLAAAGAEVTVIEAAARPMGRGMSPVMAEYLLARHRARGVEVRAATRISAIVEDGGRLTIATGQDTTGPVDLVIVGVGVLPNDELAQKSGLETQDGIVVDSSLRTTRDPRVYAVGDCARFPSPFASAASVRLESVQNATEQGRHIAKSIATGTVSAYERLPWFWTEQCGLRVQMAGLVEPADECVVSGDPGQGAFSVLAFRDGRLAAVESLGRPRDHALARRLLADPAGWPEHGVLHGAGYDLSALRTAVISPATNTVDG